MTVCFCGLLLFQKMASGEQDLSKASSPFSNMSIDKEVFNPSRGERVAIRFRLAEKAQVSLKIFDFDRDLIAVLVEDRLMEPGEQAITWNGKDQSGRVVPDEAYFFTLEVGKGANRLGYDPTAISGGMVHEIERVDIIAEQQQLEYVLPESGRVSIRAGLVDGPLLAIPVDWEPRTKGTHREHWDGRDQEGLISVLKHPNYQLRANYFTLPENTLITKGNKGTDYWRYQHDRGANQAKESQIRAEGTGSILRSPLFSKPLIYSKAPPLEVTFPQGKSDAGLPLLENRSKIKADFQGRGKAELSSLTYEIYFFLDDKYLIEIPVVKLPYETVLDFKDHSPGLHNLTVNLKEIGGQIGIKSTRVKLQ
jgi:flagellar hook assembly protein FlgD